MENNPKDIDERKVEKLFNLMIKQVFKHSYLVSMNAILSVLTHMIYHAYKTQENRKIAVAKIHESLVWNIDKIEEEGAFVEAHEDGVVRKDFVY